MTREEFLKRYVDHTIKLVGSETFSDGELVSDYAFKIGETYYKEYLEDETITPEEFAESDFGYWELDYE